jgi:hypothetical protein
LTLKRCRPLLRVRAVRPARQQTSLVGEVRIAWARPVAPSR